LTNEFGASTINIPSVVTLKIEPSDNSVFVLLDSDKIVCLVVDFSDTSRFPYRIKTSNPILVYVDVDKTLHNPLYMNP
jgi:hypothetical protein